MVGILCLNTFFKLAPLLDESYTESFMEVVTVEWENKKYIQLGFKLPESTHYILVTVQYNAINIYCKKRI